MAILGARYTWVSSAVWDKPWFRAFPDRTKLLWFYFVTCGENTGAGVYQYDADVVRVKTGKWDLLEWEDAIESLKGHLQFYGTNWVWVVGYVKHNYPRVNVKQAKGIHKIMGHAPKALQDDFWRVYSPLRYPIDTPTIPVSETIGVCIGVSDPTDTTYHSIGRDLTTTEGGTKKAFESSDTPIVPLSGKNGRVLPGYHECEEEFKTLWVKCGEKTPPWGGPDGRHLNARLRQVTREDGEDAWKKVRYVIRYALSGNYQPFVTSYPPLRTILGDYHWSRIVSQAAKENSR